MTITTKFSVTDDRLTRELSRIPIHFVSPSTRIRQIMDKIRVEGMKGLPWYRVLCNALMLECLIALLRDSGTQDPSDGLMEDLSVSDELVERVVRYVEENYARPLTLHDIGAHACYSPEYLSKRFQRCMGVTIHHFLVNVRIRHAKELLKYSRRSIKDIISLTGFKSVHHFTRTFKKQVGTTPALWREIEQEGVWQHILIDPEFENTDPTVTTGEATGRR